jgi:hypothetical protein
MLDVAVAVQGDSYDERCVSDHTASHRQPRWAYRNNGYDQQRNCSVGKVFSPHLKQLWYYIHLKLIQTFPNQWRSYIQKEGV